MASQFCNDTLRHDHWISLLNSRKTVLPGNRHSVVAAQQYIDLQRERDGSHQFALYCEGWARERLGETLNRPPIPPSPLAPAAGLQEEGSLREGRGGERRGA